MDIHIIFLCFSTFYAVLTPVFCECEPGWYPYYDNCFYISSNRYRYTDMQTQCSVRNASVWVSQSADELKWVTTIMEQGPRIQYWSGLQLVNKHWTWIDGTPYNKNNVHWYQNKEGNVNSGNKCAGMIGYTPQLGQLQQRRCTDSWGIICTRPKATLDMCSRSDNWHYLDGWCLKFFNEKLSWYDARKMCHDNQGDLTIYKNYLELMNLYDLIDCRTIDNLAWIGLSDTVQPRHWRWINNDTVRYQRYFSYGNQILTNGSTCAAADPSSSWSWRHATCDTPLKFICNRSLGVCPNGWLSNRDRCYQPQVTDASKKTWLDAKTFCANQGSRLLVIDSDVEQQFINATLNNLQIGRAWLAFSDFTQSLSWIDGRLTTNISYYQHWDVGFPKPKQNRFDCGLIIKGGRDSRWSNAYCFNYNPFICQMNVSTQPFSPTAAPVQFHCDTNWQYYNKKCYYFGPVGNQTRKNWVDSRDYCAASGGNLVILNDPYEISYITVQQSKIQTAWIGLKYDKPSGLLKWVDGSTPGRNAASELNFYPGEPDNTVHGQECIQIVGGRKDYTGAWDDANCSTAQSFICEKDAYPGSSQLPTTPPVPNSYSVYCGSQWIYDSNDNLCYQVVLNSPKTWDGARSDCMARGGDLVSISGIREQNFIQAVLNTGQYASIQVSFWIGATDQTKEGGWDWSDSSPFRYLNWHAGEPNNRGRWGVLEDCAEMVPAWNYQWNDKHCIKEQQYICKKNALVTTPTTLIPPTTQVVSTSNCVGVPMLSGNYSIADDNAFASSSHRDGQHLALDSRLTPGGRGAWSAMVSDSSQYISLTFVNTIVVKGIMTAGRTDNDEWVTNYKLQYRDSYYADWLTYNDPPGTEKVFSANIDSSSTKTNMLLFPFEANVVKLVPTQWHSGISVRWEILGCVEESCRPDYAISGPLVAMDTMFTSSSNHDTGHKAAASRLHAIVRGMTPTCWKPTNDDSSQWIQVDLGNSMILRGVTVKGNPTSQEWVTKFKFMYSANGQAGTFKYYQEPWGHIKTITGNTDNINPVTYYFKSHFQGRFVKLIPVEWNTSISLAFDVLVCQSGCKSEALISGPQPVSDDKLTGSTILDSQHASLRARLNLPSSGGYAGAWIPQYNDKHQYIQVDLTYMVQIKAIATQGAFDSQDWVKTYQLSSSSDGKSWSSYIEDYSARPITPKVFHGNWENKAVRKNYLLIPFIARYIRLWPQTFNNRIAVRWELYGCPGADSGIKLGCFADNQHSHDLPYEPSTDPKVGMWPPMCIDHCFRKGFYYAGIQNQYKCFCGNSYGRYGPATDCNLRCVPRTNFICGGPSSNQVYTTGLTPQFKVCPLNWKAYTDKCYKLIPDKKAWSDARVDCKLQGGDIASPNNQQQQDFIYSLLQSAHGQDAWIGFNDIQDESLFQWADGRQVHYTNWGLNQPNHILNDNQDCVRMASKTGGWQDDTCDATHQYVCQMDKTSSKMPSTTTKIQGCSQGWDGYRWSCYLYADAPRSWAEARKACVTLGGSMVRIDDRYEQAYLSSVLGSKTGQYWTDVSDTTKPGTYQFSGGPASVQYTNWAFKKPDNTSQCVSMGSANVAGLWYNQPCATKEGVVCEKMRTGFTSPTPPTVTTVGPPCDNGMIQTTNYCFETNKNNFGGGLSWDKAREDCVSRGGDLASFHSADEQMAVKMALVQQNINFDNFWIGMNDKAHEGGWVWSDNSPAQFTSWNPGEPNNIGGHENCAKMRKYANWYDVDCSSPSPWMCKIKRGQHFIQRTTIVPPTAGPSSMCKSDVGWSYYDGFCWYANAGSGDQSSTWQSARASCLKSGGDLASIYNATEQLFLQYVLLKDGSFNNLWIGLSELDTNSGYRWSDQTQVVFTNWAPGEPNDWGQALEDCVTYNKYRSGGQWQDEHCSRRHGYVCKKRAGALPTPAPPTSAAPGNCPAGFHASINWCYKLFQQAVNWTTARDNCRALGQGYALTSVESNLENSLLITLLPSMSINPWLGMYKESQSSLLWTNNHDVTFTNWAQGEPNGGNSEKCVQMVGHRPRIGQWNDLACGRKQPYICQTKKDASIATPQPVPSQCSAQQKQFKNACYYYTSLQKTWADANTYCSTGGGHLASIISIYEQAFVTLFLAQNKAGAVWLGLNDVQNIGSYHWTDNWPVTYTNWDKGEPLRGPGEGCVMMNRTGRWVDTTCTSTYGSVCKIHLASSITTPPPPNGTCGLGWYSFNKKCYYINVNLPRSALDANYYCQKQKQAMLVSIHSQLENQFLVKTISGLAPVTANMFFTSLHKSLDTGFQWIDGTPVQYTNWRPGQPSSTGWRGNPQNCAGVSIHDGKWDDIDCGRKALFICEKQQVVDTSNSNIPSYIPGLTSQITPVLPHQSPAGSTQAGQQTQNLQGQSRPTPTWKNVPELTSPPRTPGDSLPTGTNTYTGTYTPQSQQRADQIVTSKSTLGMSPGAIAGTIIGIIIVILLVIGGLLFWRRRTYQGSKLSSGLAQNGFENNTYRFDKEEPKESTNGNSISLRTMSESSS